MVGRKEAERSSQQQEGAVGSDGATVVDPLDREKKGRRPCEPADLADGQGCLWSRRSLLHSSFPFLSFPIFFLPFPPWFTLPVFLPSFLPSFLTFFPPLSFLFLSVNVTQYLKYLKQEGGEETL